MAFKMKAGKEGPMRKNFGKDISPMNKPLVGNQDNLPDHLKQEILDSPVKLKAKEEVVRRTETAQTPARGEKMRRSTDPKHNTPGKRLTTKVTLKKKTPKKVSPNNPKVKEKTADTSPLTKEEKKKKRILNPRMHKKLEERGYDMSKWDPVTGEFIPKKDRSSSMKMKKTKAEKDHNKDARKTEGSRLRQALRRKFGKNRPKKK